MKDTENKDFTRQLEKQFQANFNLTAKCQQVCEQSSCLHPLMPNFHFI